MLAAMNNCLTLFQVQVQVQVLYLPEKKEKYNTYVIKNKKYQKAYNFPGEEAH